jgi:predicted DNA-binding transcriptional regulator AlpA
MQLQLLAIPRVASLLDLAKLTISHWAYGHRPAPEGFPKPIRVGRQLRYVEQEIGDWIRSQRGEPIAPDSEQPTDIASVTRRRRGRPTNAERAARIQEASK